MNISRKYLILAAVAGFIVALDQVTKIYIHTQFHVGESYTIIQHFFDLTYVRNEGAAFGIFRESHETFRTLFFLSIPPFAMILILFMLKGLPETELLQNLALAGIFGGAMGNYIDRLRFGYVVDFLDFHWARSYTFPAFNVADTAIVVGVSTLLIIMSLEAREEIRTKKQMTAK